MQKFLITIASFLLFSIVAAAQTKEYKLVSRTTNADINQKAILQINTVATTKATRKAFDPVKGRFTVYVFIATFPGLSYNNTEKEFHDILVLKTGKNQQILQAYQYTLEWAEMPLTYDLYTASAKNISLVNGLSIEKLKFRKVAAEEGVDAGFDEGGVLIF